MVRSQTFIHRQPAFMCVLMVLAAWLMLAGCSKSDAPGEGGNPGPDAGAGPWGVPANAGANGEAIKALQDELATHWVQSPNGWISEFPSHVSLGTGQRADAESFYREIKDLKFDVEPNELSDSDKLNGITFSGSCLFNHAPVRLYNDPNAFGPPRWSDWHTSVEQVTAEKKNGHWSFHSIGYMVSGTKPSAGTLAKLR